jgi:hypothetical protein
MTDNNLNKAGLYVTSKRSSGRFISATKYLCVCVCACVRVCVFCVVFCFVFYGSKRISDYLVTIAL